MTSGFTVFTSLFAALLISHSAHPQDAERNFELAADRSSVTWKAAKGKESYEGKIRLKSGYVTMKDNQLSQLVVFADCQSITCQKCGDAENASKIMEFVKSPAFLNVQNMDFAVFKMYKSEATGKEGDGKFNVEGNLTIIGYSNTISLPVTIAEKKGKLYGEAVFKFNRTLWNLNDNVADRKEAIDPVISLYIHLEGDPK